MILYHGSDKIIDRPDVNFYNPYNDYGSGLYCTENIELAKEWACGRTCDKGIVNCYELDISELNILNLNDENHHLLNWLAVLAEHRSLNLDTEGSEYIRNQFIKKFSVNLNDYDIIKGYRADDSFFTFTRDFFNGILSLERLQRSMFLGRLGKQITIKSAKAFQKLAFVRAIEITGNEHTEYANKRRTRDSRARNYYFKKIQKVLLPTDKNIFYALSEGVTDDALQSLFRSIRQQCSDEFR